MRSRINIFNICPKRRAEAVAYERLPQSGVAVKFYLTVHDVTFSEPHYLLFYAADCKYTAAIRQRLEMPHVSIVTKIFTTQRLTREKSVLRFDCLTF